MSKLLCKCKKTINISGDIPNKDEWLLISDINFDHFQGVIKAEELYKEMKSLFICKNCKRLWIFWKGYDNPPICYEACKEKVESLTPLP